MLCTLHVLLCQQLGSDLRLFCYLWLVNMFSDSNLLVELEAARMPSAGIVSDYFKLLALL